MIGQALGHPLKDASYAVDWVRGGSAARNAVTIQHYGIVLLDLGLPKKDGVEVLRSLRAQDNPVPVLALSLQAERLQESDMSADAKERLTSLRGGIRRSQNLVVRLLALARAQDGPAASEQVASVQKVFREVLEGLMPLAERKQIDIGVSGTDEVVLSLNEVDLSTVVKNLVDNAIRYTPEGVVLTWQCGSRETRQFCRSATQDQESRSTNTAGCSSPFTARWDLTKPAPVPGCLSSRR
jgi:CheY-like chemotaxis protein